MMITEPSVKANHRYRVFFIMLGSLFKPSWRSSSVEKRMQAVQEMSALSSENQTIFLNLANTDTEASIRHAALRKITDPKPIYKISCEHDDSATRSAASNTLHTLIGSKSQLNIDEFRVLLKEIPDLSEQIVLLCPHKELRIEFINTLSEGRQLELLPDIEYSDTRKKIVENLSSMSSLELARKALKGRDKTAEKIVKSKLDDLRAQERLVEENRKQAQVLIEKMEYLASHDWQPDFKARFTVCQQQWNSLSLAPDAPLAQSFKGAAQSVEKEIIERDNIENAHRAQESLASQLEQHAYQISDLNEAELQEGSNLSAELSKSFSEWTCLEKIVRPNLNIADQFLTAQRAIESVVRYLEKVRSQKEMAITDSVDDEKKERTIDCAQQVRLIKKQIGLFSWPKNYPELRLKGILELELNELEEDLGKTQKDAKDRLDRLHKKISSIQGLASKGNIGRAKRDLESAISSVGKYQGRERSALDERIEKATEAVSKMGDWKDFAIEPKYAELCEQMEALVDSEIHADRLAEEISKLQASWKSLGYSDSSESYWPRFKNAGDKAYEPCAAFFIERREIRRANLQSREPFIKQMKAILADTEWDAQPGSDQPNYKKIEQELRSISNDWKKVKDVEPGAGQKQWNRFSVVRSEVYGKMDVVYDANIALKKTLIEQVKILLEANVREETFNSLQQVQTRWKQVGVTRRKEDQSAWTEFKALTDSLYEKIRSLRNEKKAEEDTQINAYRDIIQKIRVLAKGAKDLSESDSVFDQLEADYKALPELPKQFSEKLIEGLEKDVQRAKEEYSNARGRILAVTKNREIDALAKRAEICRQLEKLPLGAPEDEIDALIAAIAEQPLTDKQLLDRFQKRLDVARAQEFDRDEASRVRRMLCIDLEILMEVESPKEDKDLRMNIQLERMKSQGIGRSQVSKQEQIAEYKLDWLCLPGAEAALQEVLDKRFSALLN